MGIRDFFAITSRLHTVAALQWLVAPRRTELYAFNLQKAASRDPDA
jgi:hypothetical protein